jgi:hypothetical protein
MGFSSSSSAQAEDPVSTDGHDSPTGGGYGMTTVLLEAVGHNGWS